MGSVKPYRSHQQGHKQIVKKTWQSKKEMKIKRNACEAYTMVKDIA
jgi:hypothetical protein